MNLAESWSGVWTSPAFAAVVNHLWQSTVVAVAAWLLAIALRKNDARVRYWVWFVASVKFLVPFSVLMEMGAWLRALIPAHMIARSAVAGVMEQVAQPFTQGSVFEGSGSAVAVTVHHASVWPVVLSAIWICGAAVVAMRWMVGWLRLRGAVKMAIPFPEFVLSHPSGKCAAWMGHLRPSIGSTVDVPERPSYTGLPSGAKALGFLHRVMYGLKPVPFTPKPVPFTPKPVPFTLKPVPFTLRPASFTYSSGAKATAFGTDFDVWAEARTLHADSRTLQDLNVNVPVLCSADLIEPGVFGVFRQALLLPEGIVERLEPEQLRAIVAHEMCHVRRRDNLTFAVHMVVEILFWFFPPAWWIGERLIEERERACDEDVLAQGGEAQVYAEGILNVCKFCVESPVACAAGVTGSDLKKRIVRIMSEHVVRGLDRRRKVLLSVAALLALALPLAVGLVHAGAALAETRAEDELANLPKFDVASIKPHKDERNGMMRIGFGLTPDGIRADGVPLRMIVLQAFGISDDRILNEPDWVKSTRYDMEAKVSPEDVPKLKGLTQEQRGVMLLPVLEDRCGLKFHHETRELNVYTLVVAKGGPKLKTAQPEQSGDDGPLTMGPPGAVAGKPGDGGGMHAPQRAVMMMMSPQGMKMEGHAVPMEGVVETLSRQLGATVIDKTGLSGKYDFSLNFMPENGMGRGLNFLPPPPPSSGGGTGQNGGPESAPADTPPSLVDAVQQQLGLKLVQQKEPVDVVVIDHIEQPSAN